MREIKFRVWDGFQKRLVTNGVDDHLSIEDNGELNNYSLLDTNIIMQYTGLKDKNGKEIYEGDVIKQSKFSGYFPMQGEYEIEEVIYENGCFCIEVMKDVLSNFKIMTDNCEVIGNIYEHPHLLGEAK